jgi:hypothetical protein
MLRERYVPQAYQLRILFLLHKLSIVDGVRIAGICVTATTLFFSTYSYFLDLTD